MKIRSIRTADVSNKKVLVRVDFNVPIEDGKVLDDTRIQAAMQTINHLLADNAKVILMTHLGRPDGTNNNELKLDPVAEHLSGILNKPVKKMDECVGHAVTEAVNAMNPGDVILLENTRFHKEEKDNDPTFSKELAALGDVFIIDSFGTAHRAHASTYGIADHLTAYAGFLMEKEVNTLNSLMENTPHPLTLIMGGAKIDTKIGLIRNFLNKADYFLIGGGIANTFMSAQGFNVGKSLYQEDKVELAREIMLEAEILKDKFVIPTDVLVADEIGDNVPTVDIPVRDVIGNMMILDIGVNSLKEFEKVIAQSKAIIWNGPVGLFEKEPFSRGTKALAHAIAGARHAKTIIGGGDTLEAISHFGIGMDKFTHVSTGGGAMLQLLEGTPLPCVEAVTEK